MKSTFVYVYQKKKKKNTEKVITLFNGKRPFIASSLQFFFKFAACYAMPSSLT